MNWYRQANKENRGLNHKIKTIIKSTPFFIKMLEVNGIPVQLVDENLNIFVRDLEGKKAKSDNDSITFDSDLFDKGDFFDDGLHYLVHELYHWISRQREDNFYFADPEEMEAFSLGIAYELLRGASKKDIVKIYYPIIEDHFDNQENAKKIFKALFTMAKEKAKEYE